MIAIMSRDITICFRTTPDGPATDIEIRAPYFLFGTQQTSMRFWSMPIWHEIGVFELAKLGTTDPIYFIGWEQLETLSNEIRLYQENISCIPFDNEIKATWLSHLVYCRNLLVMNAPNESIPELTIG